MNSNETRASKIRTAYNTHIREMKLDHKRRQADINKRNGNEYLLWKERNTQESEISKLYDMYVTESERN